MTTILSRTMEAAAADVLKLLALPNHRLVSLFGAVEDDGSLAVRYVVDVDGREYRVFHCPAETKLPSATRVTPAAAWYERELFDQFGIAVEDHPDPRPLLLHDNWPEDAHPMVSARTDGPARPAYKFLRVEGEGVCEVPVGPVHAGIIEPGHFRFSVVGDTVLNLELRHFWTHKGTEKLFEGTPAMTGTAIAESVSGDNCFAHAVAFCQAIENAFGVSLPPRGRALRLLGLELERMMAHIADVGALCGDVGFTVPAAYTARLKESLLQASAQVFGTRFWRGIAVPGGVKCDLASQDVPAFAQRIAAVAADFAAMARLILDTPSVQNRFEGTGILKREAAAALGVVGIAARACGLKFDVRRDHPYGRYREFSTDVMHQHGGDVMARARIRIDETAVSARLIADTLAGLPSGSVRAEFSLDGAAEGLSAVESPRGELLYWVRVRDGRIRRCHIKSPSFQNWPALPLAMPGNIIADFPLINKSFNLSYSGCDR